MGQSCVYFDLQLECKHILVISIFPLLTAYFSEELLHEECLLGNEVFHWNCIYLTSPLRNTIMINIFSEIVWEPGCLESISEDVLNTQQPFSLPYTVLSNILSSPRTKMQTLKGKAWEASQIWKNKRRCYLDIHLRGVFTLNSHSHKPQSAWKARPDLYLNESSQFQLQK